MSELMKSFTIRSLSFILSEVPILNLGEHVACRGYVNGVIVEVVCSECLVC
jgi:hypothetical protein